MKELPLCKHHLPPDNFRQLPHSKIMKLSLEIILFMVTILTMNTIIIMVPNMICMLFVKVTSTFHIEMLFKKQRNLQMIGMLMDSSISVFTMVNRSLASIKPKEI